MSERRGSRLERAMSAFMRFRGQGGDRDTFLAAHGELRDLLEPMLDDTDAAGELEGTVLGGDFRLEHEIGRGGTGVVHAARQISLGRSVAIKVLTRHLLLAPSTIARFRREAKTIATLSHPGIVRVLAVGSDRDTHWFAMELVEGRSLAAHLAALRAAGGGPAPWTRSMVQIAAHVADALHYVHELGIVHRDVKPSNVLLRHDATPVLTDFGLAHDENAPTITLPGGRAGTPCYMAPEQASGAAEAVDARSDVFALGATLYEMLTFERAFDAGSPDLSLRRVLDDDPVDPRRRNAAVSRDLAAIVATALAKDPDRRYATAAAFADDLRAWLAHGPIRARSLGPFARLHRWARRHRALAAALLALLVTLVAGLALALALWRTAAEEERRATALLSEWQRLADGRRLDELVQEADVQLWPAVPAKLAAFDAWLDRARDLVRRQSDHRLALTRLAAGAGASEGADEVAWRRQHLETLVQRLGALAADDPFATTIASMERRRRQAAAVHAQTLVAPAPAWRETIDRVARHPVYGGLALAPQLGLVPLGPDPRSALEEFADPATGSVPVRGAGGDLMGDERTAVVFVLLPGGTFTMGAQKREPTGPNHDPSATHMELPPHRVQLDPFFLAKHEMTQAQWHAVMGDSAGGWQPGRVVHGVVVGWRHPVANVDGELCATMAFRCGFVLPTEAQWEYACRAGTATPWSTGREEATVLRSANFADAASRQEYHEGWTFHPGTDDGHAVPAPVGSFAPNAFGLHDMHGNVREWCSDPLLRYDHPVRPGTGERFRDAGLELRHGEMLGSRVHRGGSCAEPASELRSAHRAGGRIGTVLPSLGVRPARVLSR